jgi:hypothetical protein
VRERIDAWFEAWGERVGRHPWLVITVTLLAAATVGVQVRHVTMDFTPDSFLAPGHDERVRYDAMRRQFSSDAVALIAIRSDAVWTPEFLGWLRDLHTALEERVPHLDEVTSLINARSTRGDDDSLIVEDLMEEWPETPAEIAVVRERALANPFYQGLLIAPDKDLTTVLVRLNALGGEEGDALAGFEDDFGADAGAAGEPDADSLPPFLTGTERDTATRVIMATLDEFQRPGQEIHLVGTPAVAERTISLTQQNTFRFTAVALAMILVVLAILFRRPVGAILPVLVSLISIVVTFGVAGIRGSPLGVTTQMIPSLLMAVGTSASIHLMVLFFLKFDSGGSRREAVAYALGHSGLPILLAGMTTAGGLASFNAAELAGVRDVGVLAPVGIGVGVLLSLSLLPALLVVVPLARRAAPRESSGDGPLVRVLVRVGDVATGRPGLVVAVSLAIAIGVGLGATRLFYVFDPLTFLKEGDPLRLSTDIIGRDLGTVGNIDVIVDTGEANGLHDPVLLAHLARVHQRIPELRGGLDHEVEVGKTISFIDILKEIHQALNENRPEFYDVPDSRPLASQELLLFENTGADDLEDFVDSQFSKARVTLRVPWISPSGFGDLLPDTAALFREELGEEVDIELTGLMPLMSVAQEEMRVGLMRSYTLAILIITPMMMLLIGSVRGGLVSMIPNLMPIGMVLGMMGWVGLELNVFTMMVGCIAIGLAVDDTIHIIHQYYRYLAVSGDARESVRSTMRTTGKALLTTSIVLSMGFIVYTLAGMRNLEALGIVTTSSIILAFLADIVVAPALLTLVSRHRQRPGAS